MPLGQHKMHFKPQHACVSIGIGIGSWFRDKAIACQSIYDGWEG